MFNSRLIKRGGHQQYKCNSGDARQDIVHRKPRIRVCTIFHKGAENKVTRQNPNHEKRFDEIHEAGVLFLSRVVKPIVAYTETLINANEVPVTANKTLVMAKLPSEGISTQAPS